MIRPCLAFPLAHNKVNSQKDFNKTLEVYVKHWLAFVLLALAPSFVSAQERVKIGFLDVQRVISESQAGKRARDRFQAEVKRAETDALRDKSEIERLKADLDKKGPLMKEDERRNLEADLEKRYVNYQRAVTDTQQTLQKKDREMTNDILKELEKIVAEVGKQEKFTLILERSQILYSDQGIDISNRVIEVFNSKVK
jgi:outer membrane protein